MTEKEKRERRKRYKNATPEQKSNYAKYQKENFKNIAASFARTEAEAIAAEYAAQKVTPAQIMRAAWYRLRHNPAEAEAIRQDAEAARTEYAAQSATTAAEQPAAPADPAPADSPKE